MGVSATPHPTQELAQRLRERHEEIEQAVLTRVWAVEDPGGVGDPLYVEGLRGAVRDALTHAISILEDREDPKPEEIPAPLIAQARVAARTGVSLETVLLRYFAGYASLCGHFLGEVAEDCPSGNRALRLALKAETSLFDQMVAAVVEAYRHEAERRLRGAVHRRVDLVEKLLAGEPVEELQLGYELEGWHVGILALGASSPRTLRELASRLGYRLLLVRPGGEAIWAWLGSRQKLRADAIASAIADPQAQIAMGESGRGVVGFRLSHHQARAALPVLKRGKARVVNYAEVAVVASALQDDVLAGLLRERYLAPLAEERDGGVLLRETLRAYFATGRNIASAAAALGISRQTVATRVNTVERRVGSPIKACGADLEIAMHLEDLL